MRGLRRSGQPNVFAPNRLTLTRVGELYAADPRFAKTWEAVEPELTEYVRMAFRADVPDIRR